MEILENCGLVLGLALVIRLVFELEVGLQG